MYKRYTVEVFIDDAPTYEMDVPARSPDSAIRKAMVVAMQQNRHVTMDRITAKYTGISEDV